MILLLFVVVMALLATSSTSGSLGRPENIYATIEWEMGKKNFSYSEIAPMIVRGWRVFPGIASDAQSVIRFSREPLS